MDGLLPIHEFCYSFVLAEQLCSMLNKAVDTQFMSLFYSAEVINWFRCTCVALMDVCRLGYTVRAECARWLYVNLMARFISSKCYQTLFYPNRFTPSVGGGHKLLQLSF